MMKREMHPLTIISLKPCILTLFFALHVTSVLWKLSKRESIDTGEQGLVDKKFEQKNENFLIADAEERRKRRRLWRE